MDTIIADLNALLAERTAALQAPCANLRQLACLSYANGITVWCYRADALADALRPGFFDVARSNMNPGDHVLVSAPDGGAMLFVGARGVVPMAMASVS